MRLDHDVVDRELVGRLAVLLGRGGVELRAQFQQRIELAIDRQVEMRDRLLGFGEARAIVLRMPSCGTSS
jgi:hypothetical protein